MDTTQNQALLLEPNKVKTGDRIGRNERCRLATYGRSLELDGVIILALGTHPARRGTSWLPEVEKAIGE